MFDENPPLNLDWRDERLYVVSVYTTMVLVDMKEEKKWKRNKRKKEQGERKRERRLMKAKNITRSVTIRRENNSLLSTRDTEEDVVW